MEECTSFKSGLKRYIEHYGLVNRKNMSKFLGMSEKDVYQYIELKEFGMSMYKRRLKDENRNT